MTSAAGAVELGAGEPDRSGVAAHRSRGWSANLALIIATLACLTRVVVWALGRPLGLDEEMIGQNIRGRGLSELTGKLSDEQAAPLGWLWFERIMLDVSGSGERSLKVLPMVFSVGTVVVAYRFGRRWLGPAGTTALVTFVGFSYGLLLYSDQLKHYSADAFWALALLVGAFWVLDEPTVRRRWLAWWAMAGLGSWLSLGAILVVPGLVAVLAAAIAVRRGWRAMVLFGLPGLVWLASFALHYGLTLRYISGSQYLADFWEGLGYPPSGAGPVGIATWFVRQTGRLGLDPLHLDLGIESRTVVAGILLVFCGLAAVGAVRALRQRLWPGLALLAPVATAAGLALLHKVPLAGRLALWLVPVLLILVANGIDAAAATMRRRAPAASGPDGVAVDRADGVAVERADGVVVERADGSRATRLTAVGMLVAAVALVVPLVDSVRTTFGPLEVDDRAAVAYMIDQHRPGDLTLFIASATRAAQWYDPGDRLAPSNMLVTAPPGPGCDPAALVNTVRGHARVILYAGARFIPYRDSYLVVRAQLEKVGALVQERHYQKLGIVYLFDLSRPPSGPAVVAPADCISVH